MKARKPRNQPQKPMLKPSKFDAGFLIGKLRERGVSVWYDRDRDKLCVWPALVSDEERADLTTHKAEVKAWLLRFVSEWLPEKSTTARWQAEGRAATATGDRHDA
jgi:hypothetical protein